MVSCTSIERPVFSQQRVKLFSCFVGRRRVACKVVEDVNQDRGSCVAKENCQTVASDE
jgi:hypothetical protein